MTSDETVVTFGMGQALFALPVAPVVEILDAEEIAQLPRSPDHLLGLIDRRGASVPVVDFRRILGAPPLADSDDTRIVVLKFAASGSQEQVVGLRVDRVVEVTVLDDAGIAPLPEAGMLRWSERMVAGIGRGNGTFVTALDVAGLFDGHVARPDPCPEVSV